MSARPATAVALEPLGEGVVGLRLASDARPHLDLDTVAGLERATAELGAMGPDALRAVVLLGGTRHFASGAPRRLLIADDAAAVVPPLIRALPRLVWSIPVPVIAAMRGHAQGGGFMLGLWCDLAVLARTSLYTANFVALGLTPGMGASRRLDALFGPWLAAEMRLGGCRFTGDELARRCPAVSGYVVARDAVEARALAHASAIAAADPEAVRATVQQTRRRMAEAFEAANRDEEPLHVAIFGSAAGRARIAEAYPAPPAPKEEP